MLKEQQTNSLYNKKVCIFKRVNVKKKIRVTRAAVHLVVAAVWALSCTGRIIDWHSLEEEPACSSPQGPGPNKLQEGERFCGSGKNGTKK